MNRLYGILLILMTACSCSTAPPPGRLLPDDDNALETIFPPRAAASGDPVEIIARVRLDLPKYRIKGTCAIFRSPEGSVQVDFLHTSLFGSYREDATISIAGDSITIQDHERGTYMGNSEALAHLSRHFEFNVRPDDIVVFMLLGRPRREDLADARVSSSGGGRKLTAEWLGRRLEIETGDRYGPVRMMICSLDGNGCYEARYRYGKNAGPGDYPERIVCERMGGSERLSMTIESVGTIGGVPAEKVD